MQRIYYAGEHFLTGTEIANALVSYAAALAQRGSADAIEIPVLHEDGRAVVINFLVGPASQIMAEEVDTPTDGGSGADASDHPLEPDRARRLGRL
jgi:hypothetical protein